MPNLLDSFHLDEIRQEQLDSLVRLRVQESSSLEFKSQLNMSSTAEKKELCKDLSALSNSQGGYILFGVEETNGRASALNGILYSDEIDQQFVQIITSGIEPRMQCVEHRHVLLDTGRYVLVVKVQPDNRLRRVKYEDDRYYKRIGTVTVRMESADIEYFFSGQAKNDRRGEFDEIVLDFHRSLKSRKYFHGVSGKGICALIIVPEMTGFQLDLGVLPYEFNLKFQPIHCTSWDHEVSGHSRYLFSVIGRDECPDTVTEVNERGEVRAYNTYLLENRYFDGNFRENAKGYYGGIGVEKEIIISVHKYLNSLFELGVRPPYFVNYSMLDVDGYYNYVDFSRITSMGRILSKEDILPHSVQFQSVEEFAGKQDVARKLKPVFDFVWREFGFDRCFNYSQSGEWDPYS